MTQRIIAYVVNKWLGQYVEGLDGDSISVGLWSGKATVRNLRLRRATFQDLDLPAEPYLGVLDELSVTVPWSSLGSQPVQIVLKGLYVVLKSNDVQQQMQDSVEQRNRASKRARLQLDELLNFRSAAARMSDVTDTDETKDEPAASNTFVASLLRKVARNVTVRVQDVHLRWEQTACEPMYAFGAMLHSATLLPTNAEGEPDVAQKEDTIWYKRLTVSGLAAYALPLCGTEVTHGAVDRAHDMQGPLSRSSDDVVDTDQLRATMLAAIPKPNEPKSQAYYVLQPWCMRANMSADVTALLADPEEVDPSAVSQIRVRGDFEPIAFRFTRPQVNACTQTLLWLNRMRVNQPFRHLRPMLPPGQDPKAWFRYAVRAVCSRNTNLKRSMQWDNIRRNLQQGRRYAQLWQAKSLCGTVSKAQQLELHMLQDDLPFNYLVSLRRCAERSATHVLQHRHQVYGEPSVWIRGARWVHSWWLHPAVEEAREAEDVAMETLAWRRRWYEKRCHDVVAQAAPTHAANPSIICLRFECTLPSVSFAWLDAGHGGPMQSTQVGGQVAPLVRLKVGPIHCIVGLEADAVAAADAAVAVVTQAGGPQYLPTAEPCRADHPASHSPATRRFHAMCQVVSVSGQRWCSHSRTWLPMLVTRSPERTKVGDNGVAVAIQTGTPTSMGCLHVNVAHVACAFLRPVINCIVGPVSDLVLAVSLLRRGLQSERRLQDALFAEKQRRQQAPVSAGPGPNHYPESEPAADEGSAQTIGTADADVCVRVRNVAVWLPTWDPVRGHGVGPHASDLSLPSPFHRVSVPPMEENPSGGYFVVQVDETQVLVRSKGDHMQHLLATRVQVRALGAQLWTRVPQATTVDMFTSMLCPTTVHGLEDVGAVHAARFCCIGVEVEVPRASLAETVVTVSDVATDAPLRWHRRMLMDLLNVIDVALLSCKPSAASECVTDACSDESEEDAPTTSDGNPASPPSVMLDDDDSARAAERVAEGSHTEPVSVRVLVQVDALRMLCVDTVERAPVVEAVSEQRQGKGTADPDGKGKRDADEVLPPAHTCNVDWLEAQVRGVTVEVCVGALDAIDVSICVEEAQLRDPHSSHYPIVLQSLHDVESSDDCDDGRMIHVGYHSTGVAHSAPTVTVTLRPVRFVYIDRLVMAAVDYFIPTFPLEDTSDIVWCAATMLVMRVPEAHVTLPASSTCGDHFAACLRDIGVRSVPWDPIGCPFPTAPQRLQVSVDQATVDARWDDGLTLRLWDPALVTVTVSTPGHSTDEAAGIDVSITSPRTRLHVPPRTLALLGHFMRGNMSETLRLVTPRACLGPQDPTLWLVLGLHLPHFSVCFDEQAVDASPRGSNPTSLPTIRCSEFSVVCAMSARDDSMSVRASMAQLFVTCPVNTLLPDGSRLHPSFRRILDTKQDDEWFASPATASNDDGAPSRGDRDIDDAHTHQASEWRSHDRVMELVYHGHQDGSQSVSCTIGSRAVLHCVPHPWLALATVAGAGVNAFLDGLWPYLARPSFAVLPCPDSNHSGSGAPCCDRVVRLTAEPVQEDPPFAFHVVLQQPVVMFLEEPSDVNTRCFFLCTSATAWLVQHGDAMSSRVLLERLLLAKSRLNSFLWNGALSLVHVRDVQASSVPVTCSDLGEDDDPPVLPSATPRKLWQAEATSGCPVGGEGHSIVCLAPIRCIMAQHDVFIGLALWEQMQVGLQATNDVAQCAVDELYAQLERDAGPGTCSDATSGTEDASSSEHLVTKPAQKPMSVDVQLRSVSLRLLDSWGASRSLLPVFHVTMSNVALHAQLPLRGWLSLGMHASFYDSKHQAWEPFLVAIAAPVMAKPGHEARSHPVGLVRPACLRCEEPVRLSLSFDRKSVARAQHIVAEAESPISVNVSRRMLQVMVRQASHWSTAATECREARHTSPRARASLLLSSDNDPTFINAKSLRGHELHPMVCVNNLDQEVGLLVAKAGRSTPVWIASKAREPLPMPSRPLDEEAEEGKGLFAERYSQQQAKARLRVRSVGDSTTMVQLSHEGIVPYALRPINNDTPSARMATVACHVEFLASGQRMIHIRAPFIVRNATTKRMHVRLMLPNDEEDRVATYTLPPGQVWSPPLLSVANQTELYGDMVQVCPNPEVYAWTPVGNARTRSDCVVVPRLGGSVLDDNAHLWNTEYVTRRNNRLLGKARDHAAYEVTLSAPFAFSNRMLDRLRYRFLARRQERHVEVGSGVLEPGTKTEFCASGIRDGRIFVSFSYAGHSWCEPTSAGLDEKGHTRRRLSHVTNHTRDDVTGALVTQRRRRNPTTASVHLLDAEDAAVGVRDEDSTVRPESASLGHHGTALSPEAIAAGVAHSGGDRRESAHLGVLHETGSGSSGPIHMEPGKKEGGSAGKKARKKVVVTQVDVPFLGVHGHSTFWLEHAKSGSVTTLTVFVPFWLVNVTGAAVMFRGSLGLKTVPVFVSEHVSSEFERMSTSPDPEWYAKNDANLRKPVPCGMDKVSLKAAFDNKATKWSDKLNLQRTAHEGRISLVCGDMLMDVAVVTRHAKAPFWRTWAVFLRHAYVAVNRLDVVLALEVLHKAHKGSMARAKKAIHYTVPSGRQVPLMRPKSRHGTLFVRCRTSVDDPWTTAIEVQSFGLMGVPGVMSRVVDDVDDQDESNDDRITLRTTTASGQTVVMLAKAKPNTYPGFRVENRTSETIELDLEREGWQHVGPKGTKAFPWVEGDQRRHVRVGLAGRPDVSFVVNWTQVGDHARSPIELDAGVKRASWNYLEWARMYRATAKRLRSLSPDRRRALRRSAKAKAKWQQPPRNLFVRVVMDGCDRVLQLFEDRARDGGPAALPPPVATNVVQATLGVTLPGFEVTLFDAQAQELMHVVLQDVSFGLEEGTLERGLAFRLGYLRVDNQMLSTPHPIVLHSVCARDDMNQQLKEAGQVTFQRRCAKMRKRHGVEDKLGEAPAQASKARLIRPGPSKKKDGLTVPASSPSLFSADNPLVISQAVPASGAEASLSPRACMSVMFDDDSSWTADMDSDEESEEGLVERHKQCVLNADPNDFFRAVGASVAQKGNYGWQHGDQESECSDGEPSEADERPSLGSDKHEGGGGKEVHDSCTKEGGGHVGDDVAPECGDDASQKPRMGAKSRFKAWVSKRKARKESIRAGDEGDGGSDTACASSSSPQLVQDGYVDIAGTSRTTMRGKLRRNPSRWAQRKARKASERQAVPHVPCIRVSVNQSKAYDNVLAFNGIQVSMQPMDVRMDEVFVTRVLNTISSLSGAMDGNDDDHADAISDKSGGHIDHVMHLLRKGELDACVACGDVDWSTSSASVSIMLYVRYLEISPVKLWLTYKATPGALAADENRTILSSLGHVSDVSAAPILLTCLIQENVLMDANDLLSVISSHYGTNAARQALAIVGRTAIGSPVNIVNALGQGVWSFFYEPAIGITRSPKAFGQGLVRGTTGLLRSVGSGFLSSGGAIVGNLGGLLSHWTWSKDDRAERERVRSATPAGLGHALVRGAKSVGTGLVKGVTGIVVDPIRRGAAEGGAGVGKGLLTGVTGVVTKPVVGVLDGLSDVASALGRAVERSHYFPSQRLRLPRMGTLRTTIVPYDGMIAEGEAMLWSLLWPQVDLHSLRHRGYEFHYPNIECDLARGQRLMHRLVVTRYSVYIVEAVSPTVVKLLKTIPLEDIRLSITTMDSDSFPGCYAGVCIGRISKPRKAPRVLPLHCLADAVYCQAMVSRIQRSCMARLRRTEWRESSEVGASQGRDAGKHRGSDDDVRPMRWFSRTAKALPFLRRRGERSATRGNKARTASSNTTVDRRWASATVTLPDSLRQSLNRLMEVQRLQLRDPSVPHEEDEEEAEADDEADESQSQSEEDV